MIRNRRNHVPATPLDSFEHDTIEHDTIEHDTIEHDTMEHHAMHYDETDDHQTHQEDDQ